jgi:hypothetical protein
VLSDDPFAPLGTSEPVVTLIDPVATRKSGGLAWQLLSALDAMLMTLFRCRIIEILSYRTTLIRPLQQYQAPIL